MNLLDMASYRTRHFSASFLSDSQKSYKANEMEEQSFKPSPHLSNAIALLKKHGETPNAVDEVSLVNKFIV